MSNIEKNSRWFANENEIHASFMDYCVKIKPHFTDIKNSLNFIVIFSKGDGYNQESNPIYCENLESAFELVNKYKKYIKFNDLMNKLNKDYKSEYIK